MEVGSAPLGAWDSIIPLSGPFEPVMDFRFSYPFLKVESDIFHPLAKHDINDSSKIFPHSTK